MVKKFRSHKRKFQIFTLKATGGLKFVKEECHDDQTYVGEHVEVNGQPDETMSVTQ